jgi:DNA-binding NtrC family response regulator
MKDRPVETTGANILIVDDVPANLNMLSDALEPAGYNILAAPSGEVALRIARRTLPDLILLDVMMPGLDGYETCRQLKGEPATRDIPVIFITAKDESQSVVAGFQVGGVDYITKPFQPEEVLIRVATHLQIHHLTQELRQKNQELQAEINRRKQAEAAFQTADAQLSVISEREAARWGISGFVGKSPAFVRTLRDLRRAQQFASTSVVITGESGTGKELIARALHYGSARAKGPFIPVNCSAVPGELAESTFFGHVRGAFTGAAADRKGCFEQAHGGTLFLDEIGDLPLPMQAKLLRVLEDSEITPVGGAPPKRVDVRLVAATNSDLQSDIAAGRFRRDLYFRLTRFTIEVPPLRDRREDIPLLVDRFLQQFAEDMGMPKPPLQSEALQILLAHDYPGNVRELKNLIERSLIDSGGGEITREHLHFLRRPPADPAPRPAGLGEGNGQAPPGPVRARLRPDEQRILGYVRQHGVINNTECRDLLGVGMQRACYLLRKLYLAGALHRDRTGRWTQYRLPS